MAWNPQVYETFASERSRPFFDLLAQVTLERPETIVDLGCGTGALTKTLCDRWSGAHVTGVDSSAEMLAKAQPLAVPGKLEFIAGDIASWRPSQPVDLLVSNAACHWVSNHEELLPRLVDMLSPGGSLAVQMPNNFEQPSHRLIYEAAGLAPWSDRLAGVGLNRNSVMPLACYAQQLLELGLTVNAWETVYVHVLRGPSPVYQWLCGTALRPLLERLDALEAEEFERILGKNLAQAYPPHGDVTLFPMSRIFFVATRN